VLKNGLSQKAAARALDVNLNVVRKAVKTSKEGREIGVKKGRQS
jgi:transposase-like protein